jgi:hypothetical protein
LPGAPWLPPLPARIAQNRPSAGRLEDVGGRGFQSNVGYDALIAGLRALDRI